jgi:16S rRNA (uracil1498-N3)-methyltransferase
MPVYFIQSESIQNDAIVLKGDPAHHLRDVLRCRPGEIVNLVDEKKVRYRAAIGRVTKSEVIAKILQKNGPPTRPAASLTLAQAVLKSDKMDWVVQKATELGVNTLLPVVTDRTIARPRPERQAHQTDRWQKIAKEASQQCGRSDIPMVRTAVSLDALLRHPPEASLKLVPWEQAREPSLRTVLHDLSEEDSVVILIGPEGGLAATEVEEAREAGWVTVSLGPRILRAETAGVAVLAIIQYELETRR